MSRRSAVEQRKKLFNLYSANFTTFFPDYHDVFVCPLCSTGFGRDALEHDGVLTLEHCVSSKLGGRLETLTCGKCNNTHGSLLDAHLVNKHRSEASLTGLSGSPIKGEIEIGGTTLPVQISRRSNPPEITVQFVQKATHPDSMKAVIKELDEKTKIPNGLQGKLTWNMGYKQRRFEVGLLRSAFLTLFSYFGYRYSHMEGSQILREQICNPDELLFPTDYIMPFNDEFPLSNIVTVVRKPMELRAFLVPIRFSSDERTTITGVLLPGFGKDAEGLYDRLREMKLQKIEHVFNLNIFKYDQNLISSPPCENNETLWESLLNALPPSE